MITVQILINGKVLIARSAVNVTDRPDARVCTYEVDDGREIIHARHEGAVKLAMELLAGVTELGLKRRPPKEGE
jgi:hypothetical protein